MSIVVSDPQPAEFRPSLVAETWALLVSRLRAAGRKAPINDSWIAATALTYDVPVVTQDGDYDGITDLHVVKF